MKSRLLIISFLVLATLSSIGIGVVYWLPKSQVLAINDSHVGYYRGLGLFDEEGYFGKNWFRIVVDDGIAGYWEVDVNGTGYSPYRGYYPTGVLREEGQCMVAENGSDIWANRHDVLNGRYYNPEGDLISEVKNGTGKQLLLLPDGKPHWELDLIDGKYAHTKLWHENGQLANECSYKNGKQHGITTSYYSNGQLRYRGEHRNGTNVGIWTRYTATGEIESQTDEGS